MPSENYDFALAIGGAAGQGIATPGNILARLFTRHGLHFNAYNAYQSIVRGGHIFLTTRFSNEEIYCHGDTLDMLVCLNQDTMDRHLGLMGDGGIVIFNSDSISAGEMEKNVQLCPISVKALTGGSRNKLIQNTITLGVILALVGMDFEVLAKALTQQLQRKGQEIVDENVGAARAGYEYAKENFQAHTKTLPESGKPKAIWTGNDALAMGGAAGMGRAVGIMIDRLGGHFEFGIHAKLVPRVGVPVVMRKVAARNLHSDLMALLEDVAARPKINREFISVAGVHQPWCLPGVAVASPDDAVGYVHRKAVRKHVDQFRCEIGIRGS